MRSLPALAAVGVVGAVIIAGVAGGLGGGGGGGDEASDTTVVVTTVAESTTTVTTAAPTTTEPPPDPGVVAAVPDAERTSLDYPIGRGMAGNTVRRIQERLLELKFNPGPVDGQYGDYTIQAVWAFQKLVLGVPRDQVSEVVTDEMWQRMQDALDVQPYRKASEGRATTNHTEVYLPSQVVVFFQNDEPALIAHISSGTEQVWNEVVTVDPGEQFNRDGTEPKDVGIRALAHTPGGVFRYERFVEGRRQSILGGMYNPAYFNFGIAIHGAQNVPNYPASHSCIRINMYLSDIFWDYIGKGDQVFVWNQDGDEPEDAPNDYPWNEFDPDAPVNATTTTVTTTLPPVTEPPVTQAPVTQPPATQPPATQPPPTPTPPPATQPPGPTTTEPVVATAPA
jgi:hypothetical protein